MGTFLAPEGVVRAISLRLSSTFFLNDPELRVIHFLGLAGQSKAITEGVIATMKVLEVATVLNNASLEGEIRANVLSKEKDALAAKVSQHEGDAGAARSVAEERDCHVALIEKQLADARTTLEQAAESSRKLAEEKVTLEESLKKEDLPEEEKMEDTAVPRHADFVERVSMLEGSLVDVVKLGYCWNKGCFTSHLLSFDNNKVLKIINWIC